MQTQEIEQVIRDYFEQIYKAKYVSRLSVKEIKDRDEVIGYTLTLDMNNRDKPITMSSDGTPEQFLAYIYEEIRSRQLIRVDYYDGHQIVKEFKCNADTTGKD